MAPVWRPALASGLLDIRYIRAGVPFSRTRFVLAALTGTLRRSRVYVQRESPELRVRVHGSPVALATDGEVLLHGNTFEFAIDPPGWSSTARDAASRSRLSCPRAAADRVEAHRPPSPNAPHAGPKRTTRPAKRTTRPAECATRPGRTCRAPG